MVHIMIEPLTYSFLKPKRHSLFHCFPPLKLRKLRINSKLQNQPRNTIHKFRMMQRWFYIKNKTCSVLSAVTQSCDCLMSRSLTEGRNWRRTETMQSTLNELGTFIQIKCVIPYLKFEPAVPRTWSEHIATMLPSRQYSCLKS